MRKRTANAERLLRHDVGEDRELPRGKLDDLDDLPVPSCLGAQVAEAVRQRIEQFRL